MGKFFFAQSRDSSLRLLRNFTPRTRLTNKSLLYHYPSTRRATPSLPITSFSSFASQRCCHISFPAKMTEITHETIQGTSILSPPLCLSCSLPLHHNPTMNFSPLSRFFAQKGICYENWLASGDVVKISYRLSPYGIFPMACPFLPVKYPLPPRPDRCEPNAGSHAVGMRLQQAL